MARKAGRHVGKLTARQVATAKGPALIGDGGGLYLKVGDGGAKSWIVRWSSGGKVRKHGSGQRIPSHSRKRAKRPPKFAA